MSVARLWIVLMLQKIENMTNKTRIVKWKERKIFFPIYVVHCPTGSRRHRGPLWTIRVVHITNVGNGILMVSNRPVISKYFRIYYYTPHQWNYNSVSKHIITGLLESFHTFLKIVDQNCLKIISLRFQILLFPSTKFWNRANFF